MSAQPVGIAGWSHSAVLNPCDAWRDILHFGIASCSTLWYNTDMATTTPRHYSDFELQQIAETIRLQQIGTRACAMIGAHEFVYGQDTKEGGGPFLRFRFKGSKLANIIKVTLNPSDTYTMAFIKVRGMDVRTVKELDGLYADQLRSTIESVTGLAVSL